MGSLLVTGASGYIGSRLVAALRKSGHEVVATGRDVDKLADFDWPDDVQRVRLDVSDAKSCNAAFVGSGQIDAAYYLVHDIGSSDYAEQDVADALTFAAAADRNGVKRLVYLGGFVPHHEELSEHLQSRADVGGALRDSGIDLVWLRAAVILGAGSTSFELMRYVADRLPVVPLPTWTRNRVAPVGVDDVLRYLVAAADPAAVPAGAFDISNGEVLKYSDLIKRYAASRGQRRLWVPMFGVPTAVAAPVAAWVTPLPHALAADLIESLRNSMEPQDDKLRTLLPDPPGGMTSVAGALERAVSDETPEGVYASEDPLRLAATDPGWSGGRPRG